MKKICAVIVSYHSASELKDCIGSLHAAAKHANLQDLCVVVDNNSSDKSVTVAKGAGARVIANKANKGFAAAVNQGLIYGQSKGSDYYLLLNPDAMLSPQSLKLMLDALVNEQSKKPIGAVGPTMTDASGQSTNDGYYLKIPSWVTVALFSTFLRPHFINRPFFVRHFYQESGLDKSRPVEQIPGACLLTTNEILNKVGMLDEDFAIWYEDVEWNYRARKKGYDMWFCKDALVEHVGGVSFDKWKSLDKAVTFYVSMKTFFRKNKPFSYPLVILALVINSLALYVKSGDKSNLAFLKKFLKQKRGVLPQ